MRSIVIWTLAVLTATASATVVRAEEPVSIAVMEFDSKGGVDQKQVDALGDLLASELRRLGEYKVIGQSDIRTALRLEEKKILMGCNDDACLAEIGGALGVPWVISGNISRFDDRYLLNLKLMDVPRVVVVARVSYKVDGAESKLIDMLPRAVNNLLYQAPVSIRPEGLTLLSVEDSGYGTWGHIAFWSGVGLAAFGGVALWQASVAADDWTVAGANSAADRNEMWNGLAATGLGVGAGLLLTGTILWILAPDDNRPGGSGLALGAGPTSEQGGIAFGLAGRW